MDNSALLLATIGLPLLGVVVCAIAAGTDRTFLGGMALLLSGFSLVGAILLAAGFPADGSVHAATDLDWFGGGLMDVRLSLGLDGLSLWLFVLSAVLMFTSVLVSWSAIRHAPGLYYAMLLLLEAGCLGVFAARDLLLFYIFFEFTLIPLFFLIGVWGSEERRYAAVKFFLYTLAGSLLTFIGLLAIVYWDYLQQTGPDRVLRFSIPVLTESLAASPMPRGWQMWVFLALFAGFAIKVPLFPLHTWLPLAHVQAPTAGSIFLAGILLKIGTYGFLRLSIPMLPQASAELAPWLLLLAAVGVLYGALVALAQPDMKRLIAYSSVSHLGLVMVGLFALNPLGVHGATLQMINHGISTGALFALVGMIYERYHTREIARMSGLARRMPWLAFFMVLFAFSSIGVPGLNGFAGEFPILMGIFQRAFEPAAGRFDLRAIAVLALTGMVFGAWYMLWLVKKILFGPLREPEPGARDLSFREIVALAPLAVLVFWIGIYPKFFLDRMSPTLESVTAAARQTMDSQTVVVAGSALDGRR